MNTSQYVSGGEARWRIMPTETLRVFRHCSRCNTTRPFACSNTFRVNANQRKVDVWLIYRCVDCNCTWNCTIVSRSTPEEIGPVLYRQFQDNHRETAWHYAFDLVRLQRAGVRVEPTTAVQVERVPQTGLALKGDEQTILLELPYPCEVRLDKLLNRNTEHSYTLHNGPSGVSF